MLKSVLLVFLGGGAGSVLRFLIGKLTIKYYTGAFPMATLCANAISCILVAILVYLLAIKASSNQNVLFLLLVTGFCGGLSTFSTFSFETAELLKQGHYSYALFNVGLSLLIGVGAMYLFYNKSLN